MFFEILADDSPYDLTNPRNKVILFSDNLEDHSFYTIYDVSYYNNYSRKTHIGSVKIGFFGQKENDRVLLIDSEFDKLEDKYFSVGSDADYYTNLNILVKTFPFSDIV